MKNIFRLFLFFQLSWNILAAKTFIAKQNHPEAGILPFNAPCKDCEEDLEKRNEVTREFFKQEKDGSKTIYRQQSLGAMNFKDDNGYWRTIDPLLKMEDEGRYAARMQPAPVVIDILNKITSISYAGKEFRFNKNISLFHVSHDGSEIILGQGDWSHFSKSENYTESILLFSEFYPGIDLQMITSYGRIETSFIIKNRPLYKDGWLVMKQQFEIPTGLQADISQTVSAGDDRRSGSIFINDRNRKEYFYFKTAHAYDARESFQNYIEMPFTIQQEQLSYYVPVNWLNDPATRYPVVIDPYVSVADTLPEASIAGSGYTTVCDSFGCSYFINNFSVPADCEITEINTNFSYLANLPCVRPDGGFGITMTSSLGSCTSANFKCIGAMQGACFFWPAPLLNTNPSLSPCMPPPQCAPYTLDFEIKLRRCNQLPIGGCDATCILANSPWIMTIVGRTIEIVNISIPQTICEGGCATAMVNCDWGVPPYTYSWQPGGHNGDGIYVCPDSTTTYQVIVTDLCGITDTATTTIAVTNGQTPGFNIFPNDSVCGGTQLTFSANGTDPDSLFSWIINCQTVDTIEDTKVVSYAAPGVPAVCTVTMLYHVTDGTGSCEFTSTDTFFVMTGSSPSVAITGPTDSVCQGAPSYYSATASFGGAAPGFQWYLNGVLIPGADSSNYSAIFSNGDELVVSMTSTDSCSLGVTVWDTIQTAVASYTMPGVAIHTLVDTICSGVQEMFTMSVHNFGTNPVFLWFQNGVLLDSGIAFTTTVNYGDEIVAMIIAGLACPISDTATDTSTVLVLPLTSPVVNISVSQDPICAGDTVTFYSSVSNVAIPPNYRWFLNGGPVGSDSTITSSFFTSSDTLMLLVTTPNPCGPDSATDTTIIVINPIAIPGVTLIGPDTLCSGDTVLFSTSTVDGGAAPVFEWYVNGLLLGNDTTYSTSSLATGDSIWVIMRSSEICASPDSASDFAIVTVEPTIVPQVSISASDDTICIGSPVTFTAIQTGGGAVPDYQWMLNGVPIAAATSSTYTTSALAPGDTISIRVTSSMPCTDPDIVLDSVSIVVETCLGISDPHHSVFSLHPNPATDELIVGFNSSGFSPRKIFIYDALGRILFNEMNVSEKNFRIDISAFSRAVYFVKVILGDEEYIQKLVIE